MTKYELLQILTGFIGSFGFAILFNIRGKRLISAASGGLISWAMFVFFGAFIDGEPIRYFLVSVIISIYAEIMARLLKTPVTTFLITSLIPLIPGGSLYYTMVSAMEGMTNDFFTKALNTLQLSMALALGIVITTAFTKTILRFKENIKCKT